MRHVKSNHIITLLLVTTLAMQLYILRQTKVASGQPFAVPSIDDSVSAAPANSIIDISALAVHGSNSARVVLVEFSDFECPFCDRHAKSVGKQLDDEFVATGKIKHGFANYPQNKHASAALLAVAGMCASNQNKFWKMHEQIFAHAPRSEFDVSSVATNMGLDLRQFQECLKGDREVLRRIEQQRQMAQKLQLMGTPGFAIGVSDTENRVKVQMLIRGSQPLHVFQEVLKKVIENLS